MDGHHAINFYWVMRLRWWAILGQVVVILAVQAWMDLPLGPLATLVGISVSVNLAGTAWARAGGRVEPAAVPVLMGLDVLLLTALLFFTGGPENPFSSLYVVHIALAAVVLPPLQTWALVGLALGCMGALFIGHRPLPVPTDGLMHVGTIGGAWVSFLVAAVFIVYFVQRVTGALSQREAELARARELTVRSEKLASLATLSAGAAHELSTPLSTIAVVAKELERLLLKEEAPEHAVEDARLIRKQVQRCRNILSQMAADAGDASGERARSVSAEQLLELAQEGLPGTERIRLDIPPAVGCMQALLPARAVSQALRSLVKNALQASTGEVRIEARADGEAAWKVLIHDEGIGMDQSVLARAGDPFFTTKDPGAGMGLGLFLARAVIERFGGRLELDSEAGRGTTATVMLPLESDPEPLHVPHAPIPPPSIDLATDGGHP